MTSTHTSTAQELADLTGLTARRIRQLAEENKLRKVARGRFDTSFAVNFLKGGDRLNADTKKSVTPEVQAFVGWLSSYAISNQIHKTDLNLAYCEHWGMSKEEALLNLIKAAAILGRKADLGKLKLA